MRRMTASLALAALLTAAACSPKAETGAGPVAATAAAMPEFKTEIEMKDLMAHVVDPAAWGIWHNQGAFYDDTGEHELYPTTDEGWTAAESSAMTLAEVSNLLLLPGRPVDDDKRWVEYAHGMHDASMKAQKAALARDKQAFFDAGGEIYTFCTACHSHYVIGDAK